MADTCTHLDDLTLADPTGDGCEDCLAIGGEWLHLRACAICGHVGCCDESPNTHATKHFHATGHELIRSLEPGEDWWYCYDDDLAFAVEGFGPLRP